MFIDYFLGISTISSQMCQYILRIRIFHIKMSRSAHRDGSEDGYSVCGETDTLSEPSAVVGREVCIGFCAWPLEDGITHCGVLTIGARIFGSK